MTKQLTTEQIKAELLDLNKQPGLLKACLARLDPHQDHALIRDILLMLEDKMGWIPMLTLDPDSIVESHEECKDDDEPPMSREVVIEACREVSDWDWSHHYDAFRDAVSDEADKLHKAQHQEYYAKRDADVTCEGKS